MIISLIVAASENNVIGRDGGIPWHLPDDFKFFREKTEGHPIIMGRKNYESIGRVLPDRHNIIISRQMDFQAEGCEIVSSLDEAINLASKDEKEEIFVIGGGQIYEMAMALADRIYLTRVHTELEGDVFFPEIPEDEWKEVSREDHPADEKHNHSFTIYVYERRHKGV